MSQTKKSYAGSCHCGAVRFDALLASDGRAGRCNCTICRRTGATGVILKPAELTVRSGADAVRTYEWGGRISKRFFCGNCGVHCYALGHLEQLGGDYASVNVNCIDDYEVDEAKVVYWDGRHDNWQGGPRATPWPVGARA